MIPVVYIHLGAIPAYCIRSMTQALSYNKRVVLITDTDYNQNGIEVHNVGKYQNDAAVFESIYKHMSSNTPAFEMICIKRWFILRNFMAANDIELCYYTDSDVMIYADVEKLLKNYPSFEAAYSVPESQDNYRWAASACCSYWMKKTLNEFCNFILDAYQNGNARVEEKWNYHTANNAAGGICDMTLLYLFARQKNIFSITKVQSGVSFDHNIMIAENLHPDEYEMEFSGRFEMPVKKIVWKNGMPYGFNKRSGETVLFAALTEYAKLLQGERTAAEKLKANIKKGIKKVLGRSN